MGISLPRHHFPALQAQRIQYDIQSFFSVAQMIFQSIFQSYTTAPSPQLCCFTRASKAPLSIGTPLAKRREDLSDFSAKNKAPSLGKKRKKMASLAQAACGLRLAACASKGQAFRLRRLCLSGSQVCYSCCLEMSRWHQCPV